MGAASFQYIVSDAGAKLLLVGDHHQLGAVEAGAPEFIDLLTSERWWLVALAERRRCLEGDR